MRSSPLLLLLSLSVSFLPLSASTAESPHLLSQSPSSQDFWSQAQRLVQEQLNLINRIEQAIASPDLNQVEAVRGQLIVQSGAVERFLKSQYSIPRLLCSNGTNAPDPNVTADLSLPQKQVYCALYTSTQQLRPVVSQLDRRLPILAGLAAPKTPPSPDAPLFILPPSLENPEQPPNLKNPEQPTSSSVPNLPVAEVPVIGLPVKRPISNGQPSLQPAIKPPQQTTTAILAARKQLLSAVPAFPASIRIFDPVETYQIIDRSTYGVSPLESQRYAQFLAQSNTGIARILPAQIYRSDPNQRRNRLQPTVAERFPFVPLRRSTSGLTPRLAIQIEEGNFDIPLTRLNYGFMVNLGEVSLENLNATLQNTPTLSQQQREFFLNYSPPNQLEALQEERLRLLAGKDGASLIPASGLSPSLRSFPLTRDNGSQAAFVSTNLPVSTQAPVILNNTYLLRLFQFQVPDVILKAQPISRSQRRYLDQILETPSSDVLVAIRPVNRGSDGSYTILWRLLNQFPDPKIQDLDKYLNLD